MFFHYATRKISLICKISTFFEDLGFLNPRSHLKEQEACGLLSSLRIKTPLNRIPLLGPLLF